MDEEDTIDIGIVEIDVEVPEVDFDDDGTFIYFGD